MRIEYYRVGAKQESGRVKWFWASRKTVNEATGAISYTVVKRDGDEEFKGGEHRIIIGQPDDFVWESGAEMDLKYGHLVKKGIANGLHRA